jgi:[ribosomal protein S5]-alanine N-acetyltransferase
MTSEEHIRFDGGYLRVLGTDDIHPGYINGLNDPEVNRYLDAVKQAPQTLQSVQQFVLINNQSANAVLFGIWQDGVPDHVGTVRLHSMDSYHQIASMGICLFDKNCWGLGLGCKAIAACSSWARDTFNLRWIEASAYDSNIASQKAFLKAGYAWAWDVKGKYLLEGKPETVKVFAFTK